MKEIEAVILAQGKSKRMKFDKQLIEIDGIRLIEKNIKLLKKYFPRVSVISQRGDLYRDLDVLIREDIYPGFGPISGLNTALSYAQYDFVFMVAVDMPKISEGFIEFLLKNFDEDKMGLICRDEKRIEPLAAIYSKRLLKKTEEFINAGRLRIFDLIVDEDFVNLNHSELVALFDDPFMNLNTQDELKAYISKK